MNRSSTPWITLLILLFLPKAQAGSSDLSYQHEQKLSYLSMGIGAMSVQNTSASTQATDLSALYRRGLSNQNISFVGQMSPIFQTSSLFGVQINFGAGYRLIGQTEYDTEVVDRDSNVISQHISRSTLVVFADAMLSTLPIFGSTNTATYSGISIAARAYWSRYFPMLVSLEYSSLSLGVRKTTITGGFIGYSWGN